ncbi:hypothetical protein HYC85_017840 [Camellia sinensis]|uniref:CSN8/PSMD8/EIF3K domain-containing protein n=1 Tax=Camellia sinensis TaxID=4442 RepID=A0A7J7GSK7_CAMSI|nr:hypothetical protein HYC85_017840 [Camellia sinensis]
MALLDSSCRPHLHQRHVRSLIWGFTVVLSSSAKFLWKLRASSVKETQPELVVVWKIGLRLWMQDHASVHEAIRGFNWSQETRDLVASFSEGIKGTAVVEERRSKNSNDFELQICFKENIEVLFDRFESQDLCAIMSTCVSRLEKYLFLLP